MEYHTSSASSNVEIISKEVIKPSSPTPDHLKTVNLTLIDQISPPVYIPVIFFYEADELKGSKGDTSAQICHRLKRSLSDTLTHFYPLAGKIDPENFTIDCNDNGAGFVEARALGVRLKDVIRDPQPEQLQIYVPVGGAYDRNDALFTAQATFFDCGGIAVGACIVHLVADGPSLVEFMKAWSATCWGKTLECDQEFGPIARYFPARDMSDYDFSPASLLVGHNQVVTKRLVFSKEKLEALKHQVTTTDNPTRVEVVSAFIWKHFIESKLAAGIKRSSAALHAVNIRPRAGPSMEIQHAFGNCHFTTATELHAVEAGAPQLDELVRKLRRAIRKIDSEHIRKTQSEDRFLSEMEQLYEVAWGEDVDGFLFSSWCRFPVYEVDFGWGRPVWVGSIPLPLNNMAILGDTRSGDGIEAWINLLPQNAQSLEDQFELIGAACN